jgi:hypothetical protein
MDKKRRLGLPSKLSSEFVAFFLPYMVLIEGASLIVTPATLPSRLPGPEQNRHRRPSSTR